MKRLKQIIAAGIAAVMILMPCIGQTGVVYAKDGTQTQSLLEMPVLTSIKLANSYGVDPENITTPAQIDAEVGVKAPEGMKISGVRLSFTWADVGVGDIKRNYDSPRQENWMPGENGGTIIVPMVIDKYMQCDVKKLTEVTIYVEDEQNSGAHTLYRRTRQWQPLSGTWYPAKEQASEITDVFEYDGAIDYTIATSEEADVKGPTVTSLEVVNADISEQETVTLNLNYKEETGVDSAYVTFSTESGKTEDFEFQKGNDEEYVNEGTLQLTSTIQREQGEEYKLQSVDLRDREGNYNGYYKKDEQSEYLTDNQGTQIPIVSYKVKSEGEQTAPSYLLVQGIKFADGADKDNVTAGQTALDAVATVYNNTGETVTVLPNQSYMSWQNAGYNRLQGAGEKYTLSAGETGELHFPVAINRFLDKVTIVWSDISVYYQDSKGAHQIQYSNNGQGLASGRYYETGTFEGGFADFEGFEYAGTADFTVATSDAPDTEAPYVEKIQVLTSPIEAPGTIELGVWLDEGNAKMTQMLIDLVDKKRPENRLSFSTATNAERKAECYYSENQGCYILTLPLDDMILASEYEAIYFQVNDEALQKRWYQQNQDGEGLIDFDGSHSLLIEPIIVEYSESTNEDFERPKLNTISVDNTEVTVPGTLQYYINVEDVSGLGGVEITYQFETGDLIRFQGDILSRKGNEYTVAVNIGQYEKGGNYTLAAVTLADASGRGNLAIYNNNHNGFLTDIYTVRSIPYSGEIELHLTEQNPPAARIKISDEDALGKMEQAAEKSQIVLEGCDSNANATYNISPEMFETMRRRQLQVCLKGYRAEKYLVFDGAAIPDNMLQGVHIDAHREELQKKELWFDNAYDTAYYPVNIYSMNWNIPSEMWIEVGTEFYENYKNSNVKLSRLSDAGTAVIMQENLKFSDDGNYVILPFSAGFEDTDMIYGGRYYISAGGEKLFEYPLDVEMEPQMTSDIVTKGKNFKVNVTVANNNDNNVQDVAIFPSLMKIADGEIIEGLDWTCTVEEGKAAITPDGVYVESLAKGEPVRLSFYMSIAEMVAEERVDLYMHASSLNVNDELVAYGDDYIRLRLIDASSQLKGDMNQDGTIDASDLMYMLQVVSERISEEELSTEQIQAGDIVGADGKITADDLMKMLQFVSERITSLE